MSPLIQDAEMRELFKVECEEHLQELDRGLLCLEKNPADRPVLEDVFRRVHSLKGSARMLGLASVESVAHRFEDTLGSARTGATKLASETVDRLYRGLDAIRQLVHEAVTGELSPVRVPDLLAKLAAPAPTSGPAAPRGDSADNPTAGANALGSTGNVSAPAAPGPSRPADPPATIAAAPMPSAASDETPPEPGDSSEPGGGGANAGVPAPFVIDTVRVKPQQLDALMTLAGELAVTKIQLSRRSRDLEELVGFWEDWSREMSRARPRPAGPTADAPPSGHLPSDDLLQETRERERIRLERAGAALNRLLKSARDDDNRLEFVTNKIETGVRTMRLLPLGRIFHLFPRMVRDLARQQEKEVQLVVEGEDVPADKRLLEELKDPLMHLLRNSLDHGVEPPEERERRGKLRQATVRLRAWQTATNICIEVRDDGRGLDLEAIKRTALQKKLCGPEIEQWPPRQIQHLIFAPGFSTARYITDVSGRGVGMDVVRSNVERLKGVISIDSAPGRGCAFRLELPITLSTIRVLIVQVRNLKVALPVEFVDRCRSIETAEIYVLDGRETVNLEGEPISVAPLEALLEMGEAAPRPAGGPGQSPICVFLVLGKERLCLLVDALVNEQEVLLKPFTGLLRRVRNVSGSTILGSGEVCMILNVPDLHRSVRKLASSPRIRTPAALARPAKRTILLAEDSMTTRTQLKRILESADYLVVTAVDGKDALAKLGVQPPHAVVSDVQMPNLDGLGLTERIRQDPRYKNLPIILITSLASEADRRRGLEVGASAYITKPAFDQKVLLDALQRLI